MTYRTSSLPVPHFGRSHADPHQLDQGLGFVAEAVEIHAAEEGPVLVPLRVLEALDRVVDPWAGLAQDRVVVLARSRSDVERRVRLMIDVDPEVTTATFEAGVLEVRLRLTERAAARKIDIQSGGGDE